MISLSEFFEINHELILFVYGLVFFVLGLAIILQTRRSSRLELARSLRWLAAFGITHGFFEWGDLFIPIQAEYLSPAIMQTLYRIHLILLAVSFTCLFQFGLTILRPRGNQLRWLTAIVFLAWLGLSFIILLPRSVDKHLWGHTANAIARYFIGFPGGLLAAYGLRVHAMKRIRPLNVPKIIQTFQIAGISLAAYALLAGIIPPHVEFFPGNILNTDTFTQAVGAPPWVFRSMVAAIIAYAVIRALEIFDVETQRRIEELEQQQILNADHERLARELHDGAIQKVYTAGLLVESATRLAESDSELDKRLKRAVVVLNDSIADLRRNLAELHESTPKVADSLPVLLQRLSEDPHYNSMVQIALTCDAIVNRSLSPVRSSHVTAIVNEALSNIVRHAQAKNVDIAARDAGERLEITIKDDGVGIPSEINYGYGLRNMRDRARLLNGSIEFENQKGTVVTLDIPWVDK